MILDRALFWRVFSRVDQDTEETRRKEYKVPIWEIPVVEIVFEEV